MILELLLAGCVTASPAALAAKLDPKDVDVASCGTDGKCYNPFEVPNCPSPSGDAKQAMAKALNLYKNNVAVPDPAKLVPISLEQMLSPGADDARFTAGTAAQLEGYVLDAKVGGVETCNCHAKDPAFRDTHIELGLRPDSKTPNAQRVIVEVTPHTRKFAAVLGGGVGTTTLLERLYLKRVRISGWLFFDGEHRQNAENTNPGGEGNWRATCWEIHPVTSLELLPEAKP